MINTKRVIVVEIAIVITIVIAIVNSKSNSKTNKIVYTDPSGRVICSIDANKLFGKKYDAKDTLSIV